MNILVISSTFPTNNTDPVGGFVLDFCLKLSEQHRVTVLTQKRAETYAVDSKINLVTFLWSGSQQPLSDLKFYNPIHFFHTLSLFKNARTALKDLTNNQTFDHCFALWAIPSGIAAKYIFEKKNIPYSVWCLGSDIWKHKNNFFTKSLLRKILVNAQQVYGDGFKFCEEIEAFSKKSCLFLPSARNIDKTAVTVVSESRKKFVFVGRYHINKGPDVLIQAISRLPDAVMDNAVFHFYGLGSMKTALQEMVSDARLTNVEIHDVLDTNELFSVVSNAHFLIIPSRIDSIPVILSDTLQCGTPLIGANVGDLGDVITKYGIGYTFEKENSEELCAKIVLAFNDLKSAYTEPIQQALTLFSVENAVHEFIRNIQKQKQL
ncbi:MAG: glycosyltransferase [Bacteroidota bacterium]